MREDQADQIIDLLGEVAEELRGLRTDFNEFTGYNVYKLSTTIDDLSDRITGAAGGFGGATLEEVANELRDTNATLRLIDINTTV